ncbi:signal peptidase I [Spongisporangium articulatum]|uniref:Signal peptidase I n=1 Tax=Spongisporangium articulatum TaxID=3362603 RepID=A0ABW8AMY9_9ACTN
MLIGEPARVAAGVRPRPRPESYRVPRSRRYAVLAVAGLVTIALVRGLVVQSFVVPTGSMDPTVRAGDRVLVSRMSYTLGEIHRGDVIVFDGNGTFDPAPAPARNGLAELGRTVAAAFSLPVGSQDYVKRVVGLPGERVVCCDAQGHLTVNGVPLTEPYVNPQDVPSVERFDVTVPAGRLWVMGDHRSASADSRAHRNLPGGGTVPLERVVGKVVGIYWPPAHAGGISSDSGSSKSSMQSLARPKER